MRRHSLLTKVLIANLLLISVAVAAASLVANPDAGLRDDPATGLVLAFALSLTVLVNLVLLQRRLAPLERLIEDMEHVDLTRPQHGGGSANGHGAAGVEEVERLRVAFRRMLERLEAERRRASSAALDAQERERARVARELHDEVNQSLAGVLLRVEAARAGATPALERELSETKALAGRAMAELLGVARELRPAALDDLGLRAALERLVDDLERHAGIEARLRMQDGLASLPAETQLVLYRVAQEALANAARHSGATLLDVELRRDAGEVLMTVTDDGRGFCFGEEGRGLGIAGMRERALLAGGELEIESHPGTGTVVRLRVPHE